MAGDTLILKDGTYTGQFTINGASGTASNPITIRAENRHQAIFRSGATSCPTNAFLSALDVQRNDWVIRDLVFKNYSRGINLQTGTGNHRIHDNLFEEFYVGGVFGIATHNNEIHHNVFINSNACISGWGADGVGLFNDSDSNFIHDNVFAANGKDSDLFGGSRAHSIAIMTNADNNVVQGNITVGGNVMFRMFHYLYVGTNDNNVIRDNAFLFGWSGTSVDGCVEKNNQFINNIFYGAYYGLTGAKGNLNGAASYPGWMHNLVYMTEFSRTNFFMTAGGGPECHGVKAYATIKDNIIYSSRVPTPWSMFAIANQFGSPPSILESRNNLFWAPGSESTWTAGYTYQPGDIHNPAAPPLFVNAAAGDFTLAAGSPGKNAASDGKDIGIEYNAFLKKTWVMNAFALPTQQKSTSGTSASFTVKPDHEYDVWFYIPESGYCTLGTIGPPYGEGEQFTVEGTVRMRDINSLVNEGVWSQPGGPQRWFTLGRHKAADGTLNISWTTANCVSKLFIRELPRPDEAYAWITDASLLRGDLNNNATVDLTDVRLLIQMLIGQTPPDLARADLDGSGGLDLSDVRELINILISPISP